MQRIISQRLQTSQDTPFYLDNNVDLGLNNHLVLTNSIQIHYQRENICLHQKFISPKGSIFTAQLSKNKRFITTGGSKCKLDIWSNGCSKMIKTIKLKYRVMENIFSLNDECIYCVLPKQLILISIVLGFKKLNSFGQYIRQIVEIKEGIIIFCFGSQIYKLDFFNNQLTNFLSQDNQIYSFDYKFEQNALICSSKSSKQLSLFINQKLLIEQQIEYIGQKCQTNLLKDANKIDQLKFFNNSHILGSMNGDLIIWFIDHDKMEFIRKLNIQSNWAYFNLELSPRYIIIFCNNIIYAYKLENKNQNQNQFIDQKELSLLSCIQINSKFNDFPQKPYIIYGLK